MKRRAFTIAALVALAVVLFVFRRPMIAWFTGGETNTLGNALTTNAGPYKVEASLEPDPPREKDQSMLIAVRDASGAPATGITLTMIVEMPAMAGMGEMKSSARVTDEGGGRFRARFDLPMSGTWTLHVALHGAAGDAAQDLTLTLGTRGLVASANGPGETIYTCSMHPEVRQSKPGKCPICGMDLIPVATGAQTVTIDAARRQLIGVRTEAVSNGPMRVTVRALGQVGYDETGLADVSLKVRGFIKRVFVSRTGQRVERGQPLFSFYSPELYAAEQDFLIAQRSANGDAGVSSTFASAARQRLRLLGMSDTQVDGVAKAGAPNDTVVVASETSGYVVEKNVVDGASFELGARLYRIASLDKVWIDADLYEADLSHAHVGQAARITLDYADQTYDAKVAYVYPYVDPKSRTGRVRVELKNERLELKPGMYAHVELSDDLGPRIHVPASAVVYTGTRRLVFIDLGDGRMQPTEVELGTESNGIVEIKSGLHAGDVIATSGVFLIAAEARIRTAAKYWESERTDAGATP